MSLKGIYKATTEALVEALRASFRASARETDDVELDADTINDNTKKAAEIYADAKKEGISVVDPDLSKEAAIAEIASTLNDGSQALQEGIDSLSR